MKAEGTNVLDIYKRPPNCRPEEKPLIMHYPAHAGLVSAARTANCTVHVQNGDKYIEEIATYQGRKNYELHSFILIHSPRSW